MKQESITKRNYNAKHFLTGKTEKGQPIFTIEAHVGHIHYKSKINGKFENIDNTLVKKSDFFEMNKASYALKIPKWSNEFIGFNNQFNEANHNIELRPIGRKKEYSKTDKCHLLAKDVFGPGINLELAAGYNSFRKEIIINEKPADLSKDLEFKFELKADKLKLKYAPYQLDQKTLDKILPLEKLVYDTHKKRLKTLVNKKVLNKIEQQEIKDIQNEREFLVEKIDRLRRKVWDKTNTRESILDFWFDDEQKKRSYFRRFIVWDSKGNSQKIKVRLTQENGKLFLTKIIPKEFLKKAIYPVRTDTTISYWVGAGDGYVRAAKGSWAASRAASAGDSASHITIEDIFVLTHPTIIDKGFFPIDTSGLPTAAIISVAELYVYVYDSLNQDNDGKDYAVVVQTTQASTASIILEDFDQAGSIEGSDRIDETGIGTGYKTWTLNATGRGWIDNDGWTKLGFREGHDIQNEAPSGVDGLYCRFSDYADTGSDPYLRVTYTVPAGRSHGHII